MSLAGSTDGSLSPDQLVAFTDSRFTFTSPHERRQVAGKWSASCRQVAFAFTDSRFTFTSPHEGMQVVGKLPAGCLRVHDSRFTFTSPQRPEDGRWNEERVVQRGRAFTIHDSQSHPPNVGSRVDPGACLAAEFPLSPIPALKGLFTRGRQVPISSGDDDLSIWKLPPVRGCPP